MSSLIISVTIAGTSVMSVAAISSVMHCCCCGLCISIAGWGGYGEREQNFPAQHGKVGEQRPSPIAHQPSMGACAEQDEVRVQCAVLMGFYITMNISCVCLLWLCACLFVLILNVVLSSCREQSILLYMGPVKQPEQPACLPGRGSTLGPSATPNPLVSQEATVHFVLAIFRFLAQLGRLHKGLIDKVRQCCI